MRYINLIQYIAVAVGEGLAAGEGLAPPLRMDLIYDTSTKIQISSRASARRLDLQLNSIRKFSSNLINFLNSLTREKGYSQKLVLKLL